MMTTAYRDPLERARATLAELTESLGRTLPAAEARERALARRAARVVFGGVGIAGAVVLVAATIANAASSPRPFPLGEILGCTWLAAGGAYLLARLVGTLPRRAKNPAPTGSIFDDIRRFSAAVAARREGRVLGALSLMLPAIAVSLLMPLTLHLLCWPLIRGDRSYETPALGLLERLMRIARDFDEWISISLAIVGHAHLFLAALAGRFAFKVARMPPAELAKAQSRGFKELFWTVVVSAIPGVLLLAIPPLLVAVTGIAFVPFLWIATRRIALRERTQLQLAGVDNV